MQQLRALQRGQERLYEQMRVHQAQHEEQQKRAMLRDAERSSAAAAAAAAAAPPAHAHAPAMPPTSMPHSSGSPASFAGAPRARGDMHSEDGSQHSGSRSTPGAVRSRGGALASTAEHTSGGKMPRRIPSEPHSLAAMGVAGMGGRHQVRPCPHPEPPPLVPAATRAACRRLCAAVQPATTRAPPGMRKVKSTHNFGQFRHQPPPTSAPTMGHHMALPAPRHGALRASPSMPSFPTMARGATSSHSHDHGAALPHINEEFDEGGLRLQEPLGCMLLDEPEGGSDDLMSLMKDLTDPADRAFDLDLAIPGESRAGGGAHEAAGSGNGAGGAVAAGGAAASDATPSFLQLDPGLSPLDDDEFKSAFLGDS